MMNLFTKIRRTLAVLSFGLLTVVSAIGQDNEITDFDIYNETGMMSLNFDATHGGYSASRPFHFVLYKYVNFSWQEQGRVSIDVQTSSGYIIDLDWTSDLDYVGYSLNDGPEYASFGIDIIITGSGSYKVCMEHSLSPSDVFTGGGSFNYDDTFWDSGSVSWKHNSWGSGSVYAW